MEGWQLVFRSDQPHMVEIAKAVLQDSGIHVVEVNRKDSTYISLGEIELYVQATEAPLAKVILEQNEL